MLAIPLEAKRQHAMYSLMVAVAELRQVEARAVTRIVMRMVTEPSEKARTAVLAAAPPATVVAGEAVAGMAVAVRMLLAGVAAQAIPSTP
jgi:hypothetical protein